MALVRALAPESTGGVPLPGMTGAMEVDGAPTEAVVEKDVEPMVALVVEPMEATVVVVAKDMVPVVVMEDRTPLPITGIDDFEQIQQWWRLEPPLRCR